MNEGEKIIYCLANPITYFDDLTNGLRWELFPNWVCGMDDYIDDILYDDNNWEAIVDALNLYNEDGDNFIEYSDCDAAQWYQIYEIFIDHMHYYFELWEETTDWEGNHEEFPSGVYIPIDDMHYHFKERATEYRRVRCLM